MKKILDLKIFFLSMLIVAGLAFIVHLIFKVSYWIVALIVLIALLINGIVALFEDEMPGGFNNPSKKNDSEETR